MTFKSPEEARAGDISSTKGRSKKAPLGKVNKFSCTSERQKHTTAKTRQTFFSDATVRTPGKRLHPSG